MGHISARAMKFGVYTVQLSALCVLTYALVCVDAAEPTIDQLKGAYFGALVADALTLGSHYEYDAIKIKQAYGGDVDRFLAPGEHMGGETHGVGWGQRNYHPGTVAGDQTDYGEYNVLTLEYLASRGDFNQPFSVPDFLPVWANRLQNKWKQWVCSQTRRAFQVYNEGGRSLQQLGGPSNAMAIRFAAVFSYYKSGDEAAIVDAARSTAFTHGEATALAGGEFFAKVTNRVLHGMDLEEAVAGVSVESKNSFIQSKVKQAMDKVKEATEANNPLSKEEFVDDLALTSMARLWDVGKSEPIKVGKASPTEGTLPGALYFILKYKDFKKAIVANAMVGGDNASRAVAIGMVLGAKEGVNGIPEKWRSTLNHWKTSEKLLDGILERRAQASRQATAEL